MTHFQIVEKNLLDSLKWLERQKECILIQKQIESLMIETADFNFEKALPLDLVNKKISEIEDAIKAIKSLDSILPLGWRKSIG